MKKLLISAAMAATFGAVIPTALAATVNSNFNVQVSLAARCTATNSGATTVDFGTYTAFVGASIPTPSTALTFSCTRGLAVPTTAFDVSAVGSAAGAGVLAGLNYQLTAAAPTQTAAGTAATPTAGGVGTAATWSVTVNGTMAAGQAGDCAGSTETACTPAASHVRTLIVTY